MARAPLLLAISVLTFSGLSHCNDSPTQKLSDAANCFTLKVYKELAKTNENLVSSPFGLDVLLSMLLVGAGGKTAQELSTSLGYDGLSVDDMENAFQSKMDKLKSSDGNTLEIGNSIWIQKNFQIKQTYKDIVTNKFYSQTSNVDFQGDPHGATKAINSWGNDKTHGLIPTFLGDDLNPDTVMFLANAIYFKGQWETKFEKEATRPGKFKNNDSENSPSTVQLMNQRSEHNYHLDADLGAEVLEMNYKGDDISMVLMLPQEGSNIDNLEKSLTCQSFKSSLSSGDSTLVDVTMPKFEITSSFDLESAIMDLGIKSTFGPSANFSGIAPSIAVTKAIQKAVIQVDEEGSKAAAITGIGGSRPMPGVPRLPRVVFFRADHPFLFIIRDKRTDLILFIGRVKSLPNSS